MSALRKIANDREPLDENWTHVGHAALDALRTIAERRASPLPDEEDEIEGERTVDEARRAVEGGPIQPAEVPGSGGDF